MGNGVPLVSARQFGYRYPVRAEGSAVAKWAIYDLDLHLDDGAWCVLTGASGSGKSTFARTLNGTIPHFYGGQIAGELTVCGIDPAEVPMSTTFRHVGCVFQDPVTQLFSSSVERELAFGLESLGLPRAEVRARVENVVAAMGITNLLHRGPQTLSGGEQQLVLLAAFLALAPRLLVLDEPMSMLDERARRRVYAALREVYAQGVGLVVIEHQPVLYSRDATCCALMGGGTIISQGAIGDVLAMVLRRHDLGVAPSAATLWWCERILPVLQRHADLDLPVPLDIQEARELIARLPGELLPALSSLKPRQVGSQAVKGKTGEERPQVEWRNVTYTYTSTHEYNWLNKSGALSTTVTEPALRDVSGVLWPGEIVALLGPNGAGKSTLLRTLNGLVRPQRGEVVICGKRIGSQSVAELARIVGYAPQRPERLFFCATVAEELVAGPRALGVEEATKHWRTMLIDTLDLAPLLSYSPYALSTGQQRRVGLAAALASRPRVIVLDEPTSGLDTIARVSLITLLRELAAAGATVVIVTHDIEFAAALASRWLILVAGRLIADDIPERIMLNEAVLAQAALEPSVSYQLEHCLHQRLIAEHAM